MPKSAIIPESNKKTLLVLGATSEIAVATLHKLAQEGWDFYLTGRDLQALAILASTLQERYHVQASYARFDTAMSIEEQEGFWAEVLRATTPSSLPYSPAASQGASSYTSQNASASLQSAGQSNIQASSNFNDGENQDLAYLAQHSNLAGVFCAVGYLGKPHQAEHDLKEGMLIMQANFGGLIPILSLAANYFEQKREGMIVVISSVAGDRGRASNYPYGSAKAGMTAYLSGLRARLSRSNVHVMTVLPGFVQTRMIADRAKTPRPCASVEEVAQDIMKGIHKRRSVVYSKWYWRYIMFGVKHLPELIFKKVTL